ncbi:MAG: RnfABCDGE type electron transport complex subunit G [Clostridiales bacterium]|nr:RnfABCDGE type electron transport complex subunit G [Clostridiales bacterium]
MPSKKSSSKGILRPTITLCLICALVTAALAGTNAVTKDKIAELQAANQGEAMARVLSADEYLEKTGELDGRQITYYIAQKSGKAAGAVYITSAKGYGGDVSVMTAVTPDGTVAAVEILSAADETPGLGQNATNPAFAEQFTGKSGQLGVVKTGAGKTEINALTGATITSKAVVQAVNDALRLHEKEGIS